MPLEKRPKSICILRLSALGDVTHVMPIIATLRHHWPEVAITWIIGAFEHKLVGDVTGVEFITFKKKEGWGARAKVKAQLAGRRFDVLLNLQVAGRANLLSTAVKADLRLGYDRARSKDFHGLVINKRIPARTGEHVIDCFFSFLETLGLQERVLRWDIPIPEEAVTFAREQLDDDRRNLIISPCSSHPLRNWHASGYAEVADYAVEKKGVRVILCGGPSELEQDMGAAIEAKMRASALNLIGKDTLKQLLAMIDRADLVISPDSGPAHMASACGTPVIGLYAASNVRRSGPYNSLDHCVDCYDAAAHKFKGKAGSALKWGTKLEYAGVMDLITVEQVIEKIDGLIPG